MRRTILFWAVTGIVMISGLVGTILLCSKLIARERAALRARTEADVVRTARHVQSAVLDAIDPLEKLGRWWLTQGQPLDQEDWATDGQLFMSHSPGLREALWVGVDGRQRWSAVPGGVPHAQTIRPNERVLQEIATARKGQPEVISEIFDEPGIGPEFYVCSPTSKSGQVRGYVLGLFNARELLSAVASGSTLPENRIEITAGGRPVFSAGPSENGPQDEAHAAIPLANRVWNLELHVPLHYFREFRGLILSVIGIIGALIYSFVMLLALSQRWSSALERANAALRSEVERRVQTEGAVRELNRRLQRAERMKSLGAMAAGIAHDFNNLLTSILGRASLAARSVPRDSEAMQHIAASMESAEQASALMHKVLVFTGMSSHTLRPTNLGETIESQRTVLESVAAGKAAIRFDIAPGIPEVRVDAGEVKQMLRNLVLNAAEATASPGGAITIRVDRCALSGDEPQLTFLQETCQPGAYVRVEVLDTGAGMPPEVAERAFDPFFSTKFLGRGMGLSEVLGIMRGHDGAVRLSTAPGAGTSVELFFPARGNRISGASVTCAPKSLPLSRESCS